MKSRLMACLARVWLVYVVLIGPVQAVDIMHWERRPLEIPLPIDQERLVTLDRNVRVGLPPKLADPELLRVQSAGGVLYLKAYAPFETERVRVQDVESGDVLLLDLSAREGASHEEIRVIDSRPVAPTHSSSPQDRQAGVPAVQTSPEADASSRPSAIGAPETPVPVVLTRYAAQSLYAPQRTLEPLPGVRRVAMRLTKTLPTLLPSLPVTATPLGAWRLAGWTVTAVKLENDDTRRTFELDPRWLQGEFYSATFMHPVLASRGSVEDTTTVFLVTRRGGLDSALIPLDRGPGGEDDT